MAWTDRRDSLAETDIAVEAQLNTAADMLILSRHILQTGLRGNDDISPFCHDALYRSAVVYSQFLQKSGSEDTKSAIHDIKQSLRVNSRRWKAAGN